MYNGSLMQHIGGNISGIFGTYPVRNDHKTLEDSLKGKPVIFTWDKPGSFRATKKVQQDPAGNKSKVISEDYKYKAFSRSQFLGSFILFNLTTFLDYFWTSYTFL